MQEESYEILKDLSCHHFLFFLSVKVLTKIFISAPTEQTPQVAIKKNWWVPRPGSFAVLQNTQIFTQYIVRNAKLMYVLLICFLFLILALFPVLEQIRSATKKAAGSVKRQNHNRKRKGKRYGPKVLIGN